MSRPRVALRAALALSACAAALVAPALARAEATPVGALPKGPVFRIGVLRDGTFVVRAPKRPAKTGLVWRIARPIDPKVVREIAEGEDRLNVWIRFKAFKAGVVRVVLGLTFDETPKGYASRTWIVTVREPGSN